MSIIRCFNCEQQLDSDFIGFEFHNEEEWCENCYNNEMERLENEALKIYGNPYDKKTGFLANQDIELDSQGLIDNPKGARGAK